MDGIIFFKNAYMKCLPFYSILNDHNMQYILDVYESYIIKKK